MVGQPQFSTEELPLLLPLYYKRLFPFKLLTRWLSYEQPKTQYFARREFSFTLQDDVYVRYKSFSDQASFQDAVVKDCPYKIDIGAVFNHRPDLHAKVLDFDARERELVFDIDLTDYDDIRTCCSDGQICSKCWRFMAIAVKILDAALEQDFGFKHRLWVYSGRRGVHCWVCDELARKLTGHARSAIVEYLSVVTGGKNQTKKSSYDGQQQLHPSIARAVQTIDEHFDQLLRDQGWFGQEGDLETLLALLPNKAELQDSMHKLEQSRNSVDRWRMFVRLLKDVIESKEQAWMKAQRSKPASREHIQQSQREYLRWKWTRQEIMLQYSYPRLDCNVSKGLNHLLKTPFSVHPKSGRVSVPFDPTQCDQFDPSQVPRIDLLCAELRKMDSVDNTATVSPDGEENMQVDGHKRKPLDYKHTSMADYIKVFEAFLSQMEEARTIAA